MNIGQWVEITEDCREEPVSRGKIGMIEALETVEDFPPDIQIPRIRLSDGSIIYGFECWWKPL